MSAPVAEVPTTPLRFRLAIALDHADVSADDMADYLGLDETTVAKYLRGQRNPKRATLIAWALRCGVPFEWLANGDHEADTQGVHVSRWERADQAA